MQLIQGVETEPVDAPVEAVAMPILNAIEIGEQLVDLVDALADVVQPPCLRRLRGCSSVG